MTLTDWKDTILICVGFVLSIFGALIGAKIQRVIDTKNEKRPLNQILNFGKDDILFVFPHRNEISEAILPRTSTEDFLAMNNFISALLNRGWPGKIGARDTSRISQSDKKRNLIVICSPKSNDLTVELQKIWLEKGLHKKGLYIFSREANGRWVISDYDGGYPSGSYDQEAEYLKDGVDRRDLPTKSFDDYAVITKISNPWNPKNKLILIAGIRGIGTWAAAECIKKEWRQIYRKLPNQHKDSAFSALLKIGYNNCDITSIDVRHVNLIDEDVAG